MKSIRERILQTLMAMFHSVASNQGATLIRSPTTPVSREQSPALLLIAESDQVSARPNDRVERQLVLRLTALARAQVDGAGQTIDANVIADGLLVATQFLSMAQLFYYPSIAGMGIALSSVWRQVQIQRANGPQTPPSQPTRGWPMQGGPTMGQPKRDRAPLARPEPQQPRVKFTR